jgi:hypothetical protein
MASEGNPFIRVALEHVRLSSTTEGIWSPTMCLHEIRIIEDGALIGSFHRGPVERLYTVTVVELAPLPIVEVRPANEPLDVHAVVIDRLQCLFEDWDVKVGLCNIVHMMFEGHVCGLVYRQPEFPDRNTTVSRVCLVQIPQYCSYMLGRNLQRISACSCTWPGVETWEVMEGR